MKWFLSLVLAASIGHAQNNNLGEVITSLLQKAGFVDFLSDKGECPERWEHLPEQEAQALIQKAFELRSKSKYCESGRYFYELRRQWPTKDYYKMAWKELVNSYVLADDLIAAINEGNDFMDFFRGTPDVEYVHLILINDVYMKMMAAGAERSQEWTEYALGISKEQTSDNPYLKNLSFKDFLEKYPNSPNVKVIEGMMRHARNNHAEYHLKIGNYYATRMMPDAAMPNYPAAIGRYALVLKWGPIVSSYNQALYSTVDVLYKMSSVIESSTISEEKLKEWLQIDSNRDKKAVDRKAIVSQIKIGCLRRHVNMPHGSFETAARSRGGAEGVRHQLQEQERQCDVRRAPDGFPQRQGPVGGSSMTNRSGSGLNAPSSSSSDASAPIG